MDTSKKRFGTIIAGLGFLLLFQLSSCSTWKDKLQSNTLLVFSTEPTQMQVRDLMTAKEPTNGTVSWQFPNGLEGVYRGIIITDTIMLSGIDFDDSMIRDIELDTDLGPGEYLERQKVIETVRVQRGRASDLSREILDNSPIVPPFTPADEYQVTIPNSNEICVKSRNSGGRQQCFSNVDQRILVVNQDNRITVYRLESNLTP